MELVPMSMAAMRMSSGGSAQRCGSCLRGRRYTGKPELFGRHRNRIMSSRTPKLTSSLLTRRVRALNRYLPTAVAGDDHGVHQARVASRRLREAVPVLAGRLKGSKAGKATRKIRRLTQALGDVRELDVTLHLLDELSASDELSKAALQDVRLHVMAERSEKRQAMLSKLAEVDAGKLDERLRSVADAVELDLEQAWRLELAGRLLKRAKRLAVAIEQA